MFGPEDEYEDDEIVHENENNDGYTSWEEFVKDNSPEDDGSDSNPDW
ncbi:MAG: hypothetical protein MJ184_12680 [Treponema sp.]|nr:hypothetical protein [Treponema sp.]MCQ2602209.1 hypothetical protein [Treponema sp.]